MTSWGRVCGGQSVFSAQHGLLRVFFVREINLFSWLGRAVFYEVEVSPKITG